MSKHDEQRFKGFIELSNCESSADFFVRLQQVYKDFGIGQGLDVAALQAAWLSGAELPHDWRRELAAQTPFDLEAYDYYDSFKPSERLRSKLFAGEPSAQWLLQAEHLAVFCAPLVRARTLHHVLTFDASAMSGDVASAYDVSLGAGLRQWAQQIADGSGEWTAVHHWLAAAGSTPGVLAETLAGRTLSVENVASFSALRLVLILVREQLLLGQTSAEQWIDLLLVNLRGLSLNWEMRNFLGYPQALHQCTRPLLQVLCASPRMTPLLTDEDYPRWIVERLFDDLELLRLLAHSSERYLQLLEVSSPLVFANLELKGDLALQFPELALAYQQRLFARRAIVYPSLRSPEALAWYLSVLGQVEDYYAGSLINHVLEHCAVEQLHALILKYLHGNAQLHVPWDLLKRINAAEQLYAYLDSCNELLQIQAAERLFHLASTYADGRVLEGEVDDDDGDPAGASRYARHPHNWAVLLKASECYPALFAVTLSSISLERDDFERWELIWRHAAAEGRVQIATALLSACSRKRYVEDALQRIERLYAEAPHIWLKASAETVGCYYLQDVIITLSARDTPVARLLPALAVRYLTDDPDWFDGDHPAQIAARAGVLRALARYPEVFAALEEKAQISLLPLFDENALIACAEPLAKRFASSAKTLRDPAVALIARSSAAAIQASNLLAAAPKARKLVLLGLAAASEPALLELVNQHFHDSAHDDHSRGLSLDALERGGYSLVGLDAWADIDLATLQAQAVAVKIPAAVSKYWNDEFAALLAPLGEALGKQLLHTLFEASEHLPRRARQLFEHLPSGRRSNFAWLGARQWIAANGAVELNWLLLALPTYGDERVANELVKAIKDWKKLRKQKASAAMLLLCQLPGSYGVSQARDLWENGKLSDSINSAARQGLSAAAARRGLGLDEFLEQLVPDFGLSHQGLLLDVGPYQYRVRIRPDLSLLVQDENGKTSKTLPKAKAGEDADKRSVADNQFKALAKNLKPVFKQQVKRLSRLFLLGNTWPSATWHTLFIQHPLMAVLAQSVVWTAADAQGQLLQRFRPAEGGELLDLNDEPCSLPADAVVHVTHPLELDEAERSAWVAHFADYKLESPIEQWTTPVRVPQPEVLAAERLPLPTGKKLNRGKFGSLLEKWGYSKGQAGDGAQVIEHTWRIDGGRWLVTLNHGDIDVYFDAEATVSLEDIEVYRRGSGGLVRQRLGDLPPAFLNTLLNQAHTLEAHAL